MKKFLKTKTLIKILSVFCVLLLLCLSGIPLIHRVYASDFTVSNLTFDPVTGHYSFDYSGVDLSTPGNGDSFAGIWNTSVTTEYWYNLTGKCTSTHCVGTMAANYNSDSGVTQVVLRTDSNNHYVSQTLNYPLTLPSTYTPQNWSGGTQSYQVNPTSGQTTTSSTFSNMTSGIQSITLNTKSLVYVEAHANAYTTGSKAYIRTAYNSGGTDTEIGKQGYTTATSDGQSITAGGVVTLSAGTYTIEMQDEVGGLPPPTATYNQPGMSIMIIPSP